MIKSATEAQKVNAHSKIFCKDCKNTKNPQKCYDCESGSEWREYVKPVKRHIRNYLWFIRESQSYMEGHNMKIVFIKSLYKGFGFCYEMNKTNSGC